MKKSRRSRIQPALTPAIIALAACSLPACGKNSGSSSSGPVATAVTASVLSFADFVRSEEHTQGSAVHVAPSPAPSAAPAPAACDTHCISLRQEFRYVVYVGKQIYEYWDLKKADTQLDYDQFAHTLEQSIDSHTSMTEYYVVLRRWASSLHDGHVNAMYKADETDYEIFTAPVRLEVLAPATDHEKVIVSQIVPAAGFDTSALGIKIGDEVVAVNGKPAHQALDDAEKLTSGSTARMRRVDGVRRLVDILGAKQGATPLVLSLKSPAQATPRDVTLYRTAELFVPPARGASSDGSGDTGASYFSSMVLPGGIGYLRMDAFEGSRDELLIAEAMSLLANTQGLLIDVRRNGGGDQSGNVLLSRLATSSLVRYQTSPRMSDFTLNARPNTSASTGPRDNPSPTGTRNASNPSAPKSATRTSPSSCSRARTASVPAIPSRRR